MRYPVLICRRETLVVGAADFFQVVAEMDEAVGVLDANVASDGKAHLHWILDLEGKLSVLSSEGIQPPGLLQRLGLKRRRERYRITPPRTTSAGEVLSLLHGLHDEFPEAPNVTDLRMVLSAMAADTPLTRENLKGYFGE